MSSSVIPASSPSVIIGFMCIGAYAAAWAGGGAKLQEYNDYTVLPIVLRDNQFLVSGRYGGRHLAAGDRSITVRPWPLCALLARRPRFATFRLLDHRQHSVYSNWISVTAGVSSIIGIPTTVGPLDGLGVLRPSPSLCRLFCSRISRFGPCLLRASREDDIAARASAVPHGADAPRGLSCSALRWFGAGGGLYAQFSHRPSLPSIPSISAYPSSPSRDACGGRQCRA